jgi:hypothetical protein
MLSVI